MPEETWQHISIAALPIMQKYRERIAAFERVERAKEARDLACMRDNPEDLEDAHAELVDAEIDLWLMGSGK